VKPVFVVIDTVGNSTDLNLSKQEDAKAYYQPLQVIARRHSIALLCLTHLNANGGTLGRRGNEKVRSVIQMTKPDPDQPDRRRLWVAKSNSQVPAVLGVTMGEEGNEYDLNPPVAPDDADGKARPAKTPSRLAECKEWLKEEMAGGSVKVGYILSTAEEKEFSTKTVYKAVEQLGVESFTMGRTKFWKLEGSESGPLEAGIDN
jgi:hypothetical protein